MNSLSKVVNSPNVTILELKNILDVSKVRVNLWGSRLIDVDGYEGSVNLSVFTKQVSRLTGYWNNSQAIEKFSLADRACGIKAADKIEKYYGETDEMRKIANLITRFLGFIQELFNLRGDSNIWPYTQRFPFEGSHIVTDLQNIPKSLFESTFPGRAIPDTWFEYGGEKFIIHNSYQAS